MAMDTKKIFVRSFPAPGFSGIYSCGYFWPSAGVEVEIFNQDHDEPASKGVPGKIGRITGEKLMKNPRLMIMGDRGDGAGEHEALRAKVARLEEENAQLSATIASLQGEAKIKAEVAAAVSDVPAPPPPAAPAAPATDQARTRGKGNDPAAKG